MAHVITDACVSCGTCAGECPVNAISEGDGKYVICICQKADAQWSFFVKEDSYDTCKTHHRYHTFT